jgi:uncharacterized membrane protein YcaP (DUF421 family)
MFMPVDWARLFVPQTPWLEIFLRGTIMYLALLILLRLARREAGSFSIPDLLVLVLLADAAQSAMAGDYTSITDGLFLVATIVGWSYALNWLGYQLPFVGRLVHPPALPLVQNGKLLRQNMRRQLVTEEELMSHLREEGVEDLARVKRASIEGDGRISVITSDQPTHSS